MFLLFSLTLLLCILHVPNMAGNRLNEIFSIEEYLNICLLTNSHKAQPSPEPNLQGVCSPWKDRSCCLANVSEHMDLSFDFHHCSEMSAECRKFFYHEYCFYQCSPDLGPWFVGENGRRSRKERLYQVPLCNQTCSAWFQACRSEKTCVRNWSGDFVWRKKKNYCPNDTMCHPIGSLFTDATEFCERIYDDSFKVAASNKKCFDFRLPGDSGPPAHNEDYYKELATFKAKNILQHVTENLGIGSFLAPLPLTLLTVNLALVLFFLLS